MPNLSQVVTPSGLVTRDAAQNITNKTLANPRFSLNGSEGQSGQVLVSQGPGQSPEWMNRGADINDDTTSPSEFYLTLSNSTDGYYNDAYVSSTKLYYQPSTGTLNAVTYNSLSDASVKSNITEIDNGLDIINAISGVEFDWKENGDHSAGVVAQELERVAPHLVSTSDNGLKSVNYAGLSAYLISAIKEIVNRIDYK